MYKSQADAMVAGGFRAAGYASIHMDDCWEQKDPPRDPATNKLRAEPTRFPNGMKALGDYYHSKNVSFAAYTAESPTTCGGYPASANHEALDAKTFAEWGVDYMKVDGCGPADYYAEGYKAMGAGLEASGRDIVYSCSWPAYTGANESTKPFQTYIDDGCNLWRNYRDIQCNWHSLGDIIQHWGDYGHALQPWAGPGHWHDMDMLLIGTISQGHDGGVAGQRCVSPAEEQTQMAIWALSAAPLIMGNDMRNVSAASKAILFNERAIAVSQDPLGKMGIRLTPNQQKQVWARTLTPNAGKTRKAAVGLFNAGEDAPPAPLPTSGCKTWTKTSGTYYEGATNVGEMAAGTTLAEAEATCCANDKCAGFSFSKDGSAPGFYKAPPLGALTVNAAYDGYARPAEVPSGPAPTPAPGAPADIAFKFADIPGFESIAPNAAVTVTDVWSGVTTTVTTGEYTARAVASHGTAFLTIEM
jgi:hypothetical protein